MNPCFPQQYRVDFEPLGTMHHIPHRQHAEGKFLVLVAAVVGINSRNHQGEDSNQNKKCTEYLYFMKLATELEE